MKFILAHCFVWQKAIVSSTSNRSNFDFDEFFAASLDDRRMIESQIGEVPNTNEGCNVPTDEPSLRFRRWYYRTVKI